MSQMLVKHDGAARTAATEVLTFSLGAESYAVPILQVQEIRRFEVPVRLANAAPALRGVLNLRGDVIPVVDLRTHLGLAADVTPATVTVVLHVDGRVFGAVVDAVVDVIELPADVKPPPVFAASGESFVSGIATVAAGDATRTVQVVDLSRLFQHFAGPALALAA